MKIKIFLSAFLMIGFASIYISCNKDATPPAPVTTYLDLPAVPYNYPGGNNDLVTLGRVLFYDSHLSVNNTVSCGTCHNQGRAFSDNSAFSIGYENKLTSRNTPPIQNEATSTFLFWDGREQFLNSMVLKPIVNHVEMGMSDGNGMVNIVKALPYYPDLFLKAFGSSEVKVSGISSALSAFVSSIQSINSRFDQFLSNQATLNGMEMSGKSLFFGKYNCNVCHQTDFFSPIGYGTPTGENVRFVNIGLDLNYADEGRAAVTHNNADVGKFKIPNLRNVELTAPYMHDGRFATLEQVLEHYSHGMADHPNLDAKLKDANGLPLQMNISTQEKTAIIAFLKTLTDYSLITDPKFSTPFRIR